MIHTFIGLIVGIIMGLTGAGGALISIPLFINLLNSSLKEATVLSLAAVLFGTGVNLMGLLRRIDFKIVLNFFIFGSLANYLSLGLKAWLPELGLAILLAIIGSYSIWSIWKGQVGNHQNKKQAGIVKMAGTGILLGIITTLTGLGGGVILLPILISVFGKSYEDALPTSLASIFLISSASLALQFQTALGLITIQELGLIGLGSVLAYAILKLVLNRMNSILVTQIRKVVFTLVTVYSVITVLIRTL